MEPEFVFFSRAVQALDLNFNEVLMVHGEVRVRVAIASQCDKYAGGWGRCVGVWHCHATAKKAKALAWAQAEAARRAAAEELARLRALRALGR